MISLVHPSRGHITQFYGATQVDGNPHAGQDYAYSNGREIFPEIYAAADGVVLFAGDSRGLSWPNVMYLNIDFDRSDAQDSSAGNYIIIGHYRGGVMVAMTGYGHLEQVWVRAGQAVSAGQQIGVCGETGFSAGKHLHFDFVLAPFVVNVAPYYGRVNPNGYFTSGTTYNLNSSQLGTTTPQEDPLSAEEKKEIIDAVNAVGDRIINDLRDHIAQVPGNTLNAEIARGGDMAGVTSLGSLVSWNDQHVIQTLGAVAASAASDGATVEQITAAVKQAIAESVVKVDVTIGEGK